jgi:hypothetical protein
MHCVGMGMSNEPKHQKAPQECKEKTDGPIQGQAKGSLDLCKSQSHLLFFVCFTV